MIDTFVYGTLMFDAVWDALIRNNYRKIDARLDGYVRLCVRGEVYPGMVARDGRAVHGILVKSVSVADIEVLDRFEGDCYIRKQVRVASSDREWYDAQTYVFRDEKRFMLSRSEWRVEDFGGEGLRKFMAEYGGFLNAPEAQAPR